MSYDRFAKRVGRHGEWCKHFKPYGKRLCAKIVRKLFEKRIREEQR